MSVSQTFNILIVDDNSNNLFTLRSLIEAHVKEAKIFEVLSGAEALRLLMQQQIDLILLDIQMPELNGFETAELINQRRKTQNIPIVFLTAAYKAEEFRQRGFELGAADYLTKPIDDFQLISRIRSYLRFISQERAHNLELEQRVKERTAALLRANQKLQLEIEEKQLAQTELLQSKQQLSEILTSITDAFFVIDANWRLTYLNPQTCNLLNIGTQVLGQNIKELLSPLQTTEFFNHLTTAINSKIVVEFRQFHPIVDKWLQVRAYPYKEGLSIYIQDANERKLIEDLQKELMYQTELANRVKNEFLANMSHELRTPLNAILGYAQILERDEKLTKEQRESISIVRRSGWHLLTLIEDMLDLAKLETKRVELHQEIFRLNRFLKSIVDLFAIRAHQKGLTFFFKPLTQLPCVVRGDERRLRQVLVNLLGNAVKFTEHGGIYFKVKAEQNKIIFYIEDTGIGITPEHLQNLFTFFQQGCKKTSLIPGIGLGLVISQRLVTMMNSELYVQSHLDKGTIFWFSVELPVMEGITVNEGEQAICGFKGPPRTILIVDNKRDRLLLSNFLKYLGFYVIVTQNGQEGLEKIQTVRPDAILTDLVLPVVDGFEFIRRLKKNPDLEKTIIIVISASILEDFMQSDSSIGCHAFLQKPVVEEKLLDLLRTHLQLEWTYDAPATYEMGLPVFSVGPSVEEAKQLFELAMMSDIEQLTVQIEGMEQRDSQLIPFVNEVRHRVAEFEMEEICQLVRPYLSE